MSSSALAQTARFEVSKTFTDGSMGDVEVTLGCNTGVPLTQIATVSPDRGVIFVVDFFPSGEMDCTLTEEPLEDYFPSYDDGTVSSENCSWTGVTDGAMNSCDITNRVNIARFAISKTWTDGSTGPVDVQINCNTGIPLFQSTSISPGSGVTFVVSDFPSGLLDCDVTETVPSGYGAEYFDGTSTSLSSCDFNGVTGGSDYICNITNSISRVEVEVNKFYSDTNTDPVEVTISCNSGIPLVQSFMISPGANVIFVVTDFESEELDCEVIESVPAGYNPEYDNGSTVNSVSCMFDDIVAGSELVCDVTNVSQRAVFTATKEYADGTTTPVEVTLECNSGLPLSQSTFISPSMGATLIVTDFIDGMLDCTLTEDVPAGFKPEYNDGTISDINCEYSGVKFGDRLDCQITNEPIIPATAFITASKQFSDASENPVEVRLDCDAGLPLSQSALIAHNEQVEFVVTEFVDGTLNCAVTEIVPGGYLPSYDDGNGPGPNGCSFANLSDSDQKFCDISNDWIGFNSTLVAVRRAFNDLSDDLAVVQMTCNTGTPLSQSVTLAPGELATLVVSDFVSGDLECSVIQLPESGVFPLYDDGTPGTIDCRFENMMAGRNEYCAISDVAELGDDDADGISNDADNCPSIANPLQEDFDSDGVGDACDPDSDGDGVANDIDACPMTDTSDVADPDNGCSIDQLCPCEGPMGSGMPWDKRNDYIRCVRDWADDFFDRNLITSDERAAIKDEARASSCGL